MHALLESYGVHQLWEHVLDSPKNDLSIGSSKKGEDCRSFDVTRLKLTNEKLDRPKIDFLMRQSKLLGKDDA